MWSDSEAQIIAAAMFVISILWLVSLFRWGGNVREKREAKAFRSSSLLAQVAWELSWMTTQFWSFGAMINPSFFYGSPLLGTEELEQLQWVGLISWAAGGALMMWSIRVMGLAFRPQIEIAQGQALVRSGPFSRIRHPFYTGSILAALGTTAVFLSIPCLLVSLVLIILASHKARLEEEFLSLPQAFGNEYRSYMLRTGRFLPRLRL